MPDQEKDFTDIEICILPRQEAEYPVMLRLDGCQVFSGSLPAEIDLERLAVTSESAGDYLHDLLLSSPDLQRGWALGRAKDSRVRLNIHPNAAVLHGLPWELLRDGGQWVAASAGTPFSRHIDAAADWGEPPSARTLRVLAAIASPTDLEFLDLPAVDPAAERSAIEAALSGLGSALEIAFVDKIASLPALEEKLRRGFHVLHCTGYARYNRARTQAALLLQHEDGSASATSAERLAQMLSSLPSRPALVLLSPCQSAARAPDDALASLAPQLVQAGVPAAVALPAPMSPTAYRLFLQAFYSQAAAHGQVDLALNQARAALLEAGQPGFELPLLFMRAAESRLWRSGAPGQPATGAVDFAPLFAPLKRATRIFLEPGKSDILRAIACLEEESGKGEGADEKRVRRAFHYLYDSAPEIWQSAVAALTAPVEGLSPLVQKVAWEEKRKN